MADSTHYKEAYLRLKESYDYARDYYKILEKSVFVEGQTPWFTILANPGDYWKQAREATGEKYNLEIFLASVNSGSTEAEEINIARDSRFK